ncbi:DUF2752 domain-containing protein [Flavobacterium hungaricum]|uniref:DUF2752 domain-containing protein n=1 Tax=Flavobacterium hungaricum TaxID=2082725 RepID=A0ABR9TEZ7_9FLAO|nr:DUF2752 domain-containing protein [Flavobacterium hungaricum]MBE8723926.1 DUF2752 domain-containing protein [Flavobacterium hungaricum]
MLLENYMIPCLFKTYFGFECLGCGFQRSLFLLFQGRFSEAFKMYPAIFTTLLFFVFLIFYFQNKTKIPQKLVWQLAFINFIFIIIGYGLKHFYF